MPRKCVGIGSIEDEQRQEPMNLGKKENELTNLLKLLRTRLTIARKILRF